MRTQASSTFCAELVELLLEEISTQFLFCVHQPARGKAALVVVPKSCVDLRLEGSVDKAERRAYKRFVVCGKLGRKRYETT